MPLACKGIDRPAVASSSSSASSDMTLAPPWGRLDVDSTCPVPFSPAGIDSAMMNTKSDTEASTVDGFVSFEDWKKIKFAEHDEANLTLDDLKANDTLLDGTDTMINNSNTTIQPQFLPLDG